MNKKILIASSALSLAMLVATPVFADTDYSNKGEGHGIGLGALVRLFDGKGDVKANFEKHDKESKESKEWKKDKDERKEHKNATSTDSHGKTTLVGTVTSVNGTTLTVLGRDNVSYTVTAANASFTGSGDATITASDVRVGDHIVVRGTVSGTLVTATKITDGAIHARTFLSAIGAAGLGVVTSVNGSTFTIDPIGKNATTTVSTNASTTYRVNGTATTSGALAVGSKVLLMGTTTSDSSISASLVSIFSKGFGFVKHMFRM